MECLQGALKGGFSPETTAFVDDNGGVDGDDLFVDELLDFSNGFSESEEPEEKELKEKNSCYVSEEKLTVACENCVLSENDDFVSLPQSVPVEGLESLEWLSNFVEDSFSDYSLTGKLPPKPAANRPEPPVTVHEPPYFTTPVQTKARTKRARTGVRVWPVLSDSSATSSVSSTSSTTSFSPPNYEYFLGKLPVKEKKKTVVATPGGGRGNMAAQPRRCSHCGVTKTPQWRAGPFGSKTLCNACGVRYKSGRLLPEYRPACSPTYSSELHSNNHRKVLEMRRKRETEIDAAGFLTV